MTPVTLNRKEILNTFLLAVGYAVFFYCFQFFLNKSGLAATMPDNENLLHWDAGWYKSLAERGYEFSDKHSSTSGFFYLFPLIWKLISTSVWGIVMLNIIFFSAGFSILTSLFDLSTTDKLLWLSVPTVYFAFVPYTEALFFLLGSCLLYGITARNNKWIIGSLFLLALTRVTVIFIVPGLLVMSLLSHERKDWGKATLQFLWLYLLPAIAGLGVFIVYQYLQTGVWFAYFIQQSTFWGHKYGMPMFPFKCLGGNSTIGISAIAVFIDLIALGSILYMGVRWLAKGKQPANKLLVLSSVYLFLVLYFTVFYNPAYEGNYTNTNSTGVLRYSMMSPFFYIFLQHFVSERRYKWQHYLLAFLVANIAYLSFGSYLHLQAFLFFNFNTLLIFLHMYYGKSKGNFGLIAIAVSFFLQVHLFQLFIANGVFPD